MTIEIEAGRVPHSFAFFANEWVTARSLASNFFERATFDLGRHNSDAALWSPDQSKAQGLSLTVISIPSDGNETHSFAKARMSGAPGPLDGCIPPNLGFQRWYFSFGLDL